MYLLFFIGFTVFLISVEQMFTISPGYIVMNFEVAQNYQDIQTQFVVMNFVYAGF